MMIHTLGLLLATMGSGPNLDGAQFQRVITGSLSEIKDVTLICEGEIRRRDGRDGEETTTYQSIYSFRDDGASLLDIFLRPRADAPLVRDINAVLHQKLTELLFVNDIGSSKRSESPGGPGVLNRPGSPERILFYWYFKFLDDPETAGFENQGWENLDGHKCLKIQLAQSPKGLPASIPADRRPTVRFWVDIERGVQPLKVEYYIGPNLLFRTDKIQLAQLPLGDDRMIWFPIRGETNSYGNPTMSPGGSEFSSNPTYTETYAVLDGSVQFNRDLPDRYFTVDRKDAYLGNEDLRRLQRELNHAIPKRQEILRTDRASVTAALEQKLAVAQKQARLLDASSAARENQVWTTIVQVVFGGLGCALVAVALYYKRRVA